MTTGLTANLSITYAEQEKAITCPHCMGLLDTLVDTSGRGAPGKGVGGGGYVNNIHTVVKLST